MAISISFAQEHEELDIINILTEYQMGYPGEIDEVLVAKDEGEIVGGAKISQCDEDWFFLEVIGVKDGLQSQGVGKALLATILEDPWECCKEVFWEKGIDEEFTMATLARGYAVGFYEKMGFRPCTLEDIPEWYRDQCEECPEQEECQPVPMIYYGGKNK